MQTVNEVIAKIKQDYARKQEEEHALRVALGGKRFANAQHPKGLPKEPKK